MQDSSGHRRSGRYQIPPERLTELFGAQFYRFLPGLDASGRSRTNDPSSSEASTHPCLERAHCRSYSHRQAATGAVLQFAWVTFRLNCPWYWAPLCSSSPQEQSSTAGSADTRQLYSVHLPTLTSASSLMARSEEGALEAHSSEGRLLMKGRSAESLASGSEARTIHASTRAMLAIRRSRILGMPIAYYALLMGSMALCAFSYTYASKTMRERSAHIPGHAHMAAKKGQAALLNVRVPQSSSTGKDLAYTTWHQQPPSVRAHGGRRRHAKHSARKNKRSGRRSHSAAATEASTKAAAEDVDLTPDNVPSAHWEPPFMETTPSAVEDTATITSDTRFAAVGTDRDRRQHRSKWNVQLIGEPRRVRGSVRVLLRVRRQRDVGIEHASAGTIRRPCHSNKPMMLDACWIVIH
ncbi:uncharacterized protein LOC119456997 [Dermacentor silvarum]|uniref:uncharacterized protein LOC119456997 n=1 Tax=Dermacentor silvarum TaxID=543639 RepID=UPI002101A600|nr:uncharacterized protein LOC119456997 [Dermacentor silvarum]